MRFFIQAVFIFLAVSCSQSDKIPDHILSQEQMVGVFSDIALAEGYVDAYYTSDSLKVKDSILTSEVDKVLRIHNIDQKKFRESYDFYKTHPVLFRVVVDTANARAQRNRDKLYNRKPVLTTPD